MIYFKWLVDEYVQGQDFAPSNSERVENRVREVKASFRVFPMLLGRTTSDVSVRYNIGRMDINDRLYPFEITGSN